MPSRNNWIFLRGLGRHAIHWGPFLEIFKKNFPEDKFELLDIQGNGSQAHIPSFTKIADNVRDLRHRSEGLKNGKVTLLSMSLGSMIAIKWAELFPEDLNGIVCMNTSDGKNSKFYERLRPHNLVILAKNLSRVSDQLEYERMVAQMIAPNFDDSEKWAQVFSKYPPATRKNIVYQLLAAKSFKLPAEKPNLPVLLLGSNNDPFVNPNCTKKIAVAWKIDSHWHPTAGHDLALEDPQWVCREIQNFKNI